MAEKANYSENILLTRSQVIWLSGLTLFVISSSLLQESETLERLNSTKQIVQFIVYLPAFWVNTALLVHLVNHY